MRDKVLCRGRAELKPAQPKKISLSDERELLDRDKYFEILSGIFVLYFFVYSVQVSNQGGVKMKMKMRMSINESLDFSVSDRIQMHRKFQSIFRESVSRQELDTICISDSLFRDSLIAFGDLSSHSGGGNNAKHYFAIK